MKIVNALTLSEFARYMGWSYEKARRVANMRLFDVIRAGRNISVRMDVAERFRDELTVRAKQ